MMIVWILKLQKSIILIFAITKITKTFAFGRVYSVCISSLDKIANGFMHLERRKINVCFNICVLIDVFTYGLRFDIVKQIKFLSS